MEITMEACVGRGRGMGRGVLPGVYVCLCCVLCVCSRVRRVVVLRCSSSTPTHYCTQYRSGTMTHRHRGRWPFSKAHVWAHMYVSYVETRCCTGPSCRSSSGCPSKTIWSIYMYRTPLCLRSDRGIGGGSVCLPTLTSSLSCVCV
jgi:hypothetical protein